jgi:hypothetical protein
LCRIAQSSTDEIKKTNVIVRKSSPISRSPAAFAVAATQRIDTCRKLRFLGSRRKNVAEAIQENPP